MKYNSNPHISFHNYFLRIKFKMLFIIAYILDKINLFQIVFIIATIRKRNPAADRPLRQRAECSRLPVWDARLLTRLF